MLENMRNIGIMAHIDAGKTTTTERILFYTGKIHRIGEIDEGEATMDWMAQEQERGITIQSAATTTYWRKRQINIIDTPGHVDFTAEVERSLRVLDGAVAVLCAVGGVQPQTETVWRQADAYDVPRVCFVNKMDRTGADFFSAMNDLRTKFSARPLPLQIPLLEDNNFAGVIDLLTLEELRWDADSDGERYERTPVSEVNKTEALNWREKMLDVLTSFSDAAADAYLAGEELTEDMLKSEIRRGTIARAFVPVLCGSARKNTGVQPLLDAIVDYLPAPNEVPPAAAYRADDRKGGFAKKNEDNLSIPCDENGPAVGLVFKIQNDREAGSLCYVRMYSGKFSNSDVAYNAGKRKRERVNRILRMHSNKSEPLDAIKAGDIAVFIGLKFAQTGDTLCTEKFPVLLEQMHFPEPVISVAIEPKTLSERDRLQEVIAILAKEDPTFTSREDQETGQLIISGMGELHIDVLIRRMLDDYHVEARIGNPQVTYRESIAAAAERTESFSRLIAGKENAARLTMRAEPLERGSGNKYVCAVKNRSIPQELLDAAERAVEASFASGIRYGYPCVDIGITLLDAEYDEQTSTPFAFEACASACFDALCQSASPQVLEPVMEVDIVSPKEFVGEAMSLVTRRGGLIQSLDSKPSEELIHAQAPMAVMFGFSTALRSISQGRAAFSMRFDHFELKAGGF